MAVSYKKLFKIMIDRNMKRKDLQELTGISYATITKLYNGDNVTMEVIEKIQEFIRKRTFQVKNAQRLKSQYL